MAKFLTLFGLMLASPILGQNIRPLVVRFGSKNVKFGDKTWSLNLGSMPTDTHVPVTAEMMKAGFWEYFAKTYNKYGYIKRSQSHRDKFMHTDQYHFCLEDNYIIHNFLKGESAVADNLWNMKYPYFQDIEGSPLRVNLVANGNIQVRDGDGIMSSGDDVQFSIDDVNCQGESKLWLLKSTYEMVVANSININALLNYSDVKIEPVSVIKEGVNAEQFRQAQSCSAGFAAQNKDLSLDLQTEKDNLAAQKLKVSEAVKELNAAKLELLSVKAINANFEGDPKTCSEPIELPVDNGDSEEEAELGEITIPENLTGKCTVLTTNMESITDAIFVVCGGEKGNRQKGIDTCASIDMKLADFHSSEFELILASPELPASSYMLTAGYYLNTPTNGNVWHFYDSTDPDRKYTEYPMNQWSSNSGSWCTKGNSNDRNLCFYTGANGYCDGGTTYSKYAPVCVKRRPGSDFPGTTEEDYEADYNPDGFNPENYKDAYGNYFYDY